MYLYIAKRYICRLLILRRCATIRLSILSRCTLMLFAVTRGPLVFQLKKNLISLEHVARKISVETKERKHWFSVMYRKCQCLPKWQVNHETISPQQTMARGQRDSFRSWTELQISIYFWCREVFQEVCVCVCFGRCMCARVGGLVGRSGGLGEGSLRTAEELLPGLLLYSWGWERGKRRKRG